MRLRTSALVVTHDHGKYVAEALRSALSQTRPPEEIVVVDDGSSDDTIAQVASVGDPRVRVIALPHRGIEALARTYTVGAEACSGDLIAILEGDDRWPPEKLERQLHAFEDANVVLAHGLYSVIGAQGRVLHDGVGPSVAVPEGRYDARPYLLRASYIMAVTVVVRRHALLAAGGFGQLPGTPHWDYPTFLDLARRGDFAFQRTVLGEWRRHGASATYRLAGFDLRGIDESVRLALQARAEMADADLPSPDRIRRSWAEAYAHMMWQAARVLLINRRFAEARALLLPALRRPCAAALRARLALALVASIAGVDVEGLARAMRGRSVLGELD